MHPAAALLGTIERTHRPLPFRVLFCLLIILLPALAVPVSAGSHAFNPEDAFRTTINSTGYGDAIITMPVSVAFASTSSGDPPITPVITAGSGGTVMSVPVSAAIGSISPGDGSLQAAIDAAAPGDTIVLNPGTYREHGITVSKNIFIRANESAGGNRDNTIIDAQALDRIFTVSSGNLLFIENLTLQNGQASGNGGAVYSQGGFLIVVSSTISHCSASDSGGAVFSHDGIILVVSSTVSYSSAPNGGGALYTDGGTTLIDSSTFSYCSTTGNDYYDAGGAINAISGTLIISSSTFSHCSTRKWGGAIESYSSLTITSSTFSDCSATDGGAVDFYENGAIITSSTFTNCSASGYGGAIWASSSAGTVHHCRIYDSGRAIYGSFDATNNWWGSNAEPSGFVEGNNHYTPWLVLGITAQPADVPADRFSQIRANLTYNSGGTDTSGGGIFVPDAILTTFAVTAGSGSVRPLTAGTADGIARTDFWPAGTGRSTLSATVDDQTVFLSQTVSAAPPGWQPPDSGDDFPPATVPQATASGPGSAPAPMTVTVNIGGDTAAGQATMTGTELSGLGITGTLRHDPGSNVTAPPGIVYQYISLVPARFATITNTVINFTVPQSWVDRNHIAPGSIVLYYQTANGWEALPTTGLYTKDGTVYLSAQSPGFPLFAIAGSPAEPAPVTATTAPAVVSSPPEEQALSPPTNRGPVTTQTTAPPGIAALPSAPLPLMEIIVVVAAIVILGTGGFLARRWWIRRQNPALFRDPE